MFYLRRYKNDTTVCGWYFFVSISIIGFANNRNKCPYLFVIENGDNKYL